MTIKKIILDAVETFSSNQREHTTALDRLKQQMLLELYRRYDKVYQHSPDSAYDTLRRGTTREDIRRIETVYHVVAGTPLTFDQMVVDGYSIALLMAVNEQKQAVVDVEPETAPVVTAVSPPVISSLVNDGRFQQYMLNWFMSVGENASLARAVNMSRPIFGGQAAYGTRDIKLVLSAASKAGLIKGRRFPADWLAAVDQDLNQVVLATSLNTSSAENSSIQLSKYFTTATA